MYIWCLIVSEVVVGTVSKLGKLDVLEKEVEIFTWLYVYVCM